MTQPPTVQELTHSMCTCAYHCANRCEPQHCNEWCKCWCHAREYTQKRELWAAIQLNREHHKV